MILNASNAPKGTAVLEMARHKFARLDGTKTGYHKALACDAVKTINRLSEQDDEMKKNISQIKILLLEQ